MQQTQNTVTPQGGSTDTPIAEQENTNSVHPVEGAEGDAEDERQMTEVMANLLTGTEQPKAEPVKHPFPINQEKTHYLIPEGEKFQRGDEMFYKGGWYEVGKEFINQAAVKDKDNKGLFRRPIAQPKAVTTRSSSGTRTSSGGTKASTPKTSSGISCAGLHADIVVSLLEKDFYVKQDSRKGNLIANRHAKGRECTLEIHETVLIYKPKNDTMVSSPIADFDFGIL